ncbi:MAG TPA: HlyD family efflux transporter periplasmic adaptor subunit, partial [Planctomycetaceae bacterium]|nr:HlyD family efflux transporter periplasmic adaptor subunit [Planctomycetaceae bacterium]
EGEFWNAFEEFSYQLHRSLVLSTVADIAVNDGRVLLGCDRLSLAVYRGKKVSIQAVSGQDQVNRRSEEVRSLRDLAEESIAVGAALDFRGQEGADTPAPHLAEMFARHVEHTGARLILAIPLFAPAERRHDADKDFKSEPIRRTVGCLLIERFHERTLPAGREARLPMLADHVGASLTNALEQQNVYLLPTRRVLGKGLDYFRGRFLAKTLLILGVILVVTVSLILIPWEYRVEAEGRLMPSEQRRIFAPWDGMVVSVSVENGQPVRAGDELIRIENDELHAELVARQNELREKQKLLLSHRAKQQQAARTGDKASEIEFRGQYAETNLEIEGLQLQLEILLAREQSLTVTSPIDGVVATFQVQERLATGRPVNRGEILLEVMDENSPWRLELQVPEYRMGHLLRAADVRGDEPLDVEYVLATDVETTYAGSLTSVGIATRSEVDQETGTVVRMFVETDKSQLPHLRIGAEATGKVACGERSLGYVLFGDVWEFVLRYVWL